jgi:hypothetical protein
MKAGFRLPAPRTSSLFLRFCADSGHFSTLSGRHKKRAGFIFKAGATMHILIIKDILSRRSTEAVSAAVKTQRVLRIIPPLLPHLL